MVANKRDALWFPKQEDSCNAAIDWDVIFICALSTENIVPTVSSNKALPRSFKFKDPSETDRRLLNNVSFINQIFYGDWGYNQIKNIYLFWFPPPLLARAERECCTLSVFQTSMFVCMFSLLMQTDPTALRSRGYRHLKWNKKRNLFTAFFPYSMGALLVYWHTWY